MVEFLREKFAELEHKQWSHWTKYLLLKRHDDKDRERWLVQMNTEYNDLSEKEKNSDRKWADKVIKLIKKEDVDLAEFLSNRLEYSPELIRDLIKEFREKRKKIVDGKAKCTFCKEFKLITEFNKCHKSRLGIKSRCKSCSSRRNN